jgi:imidazole glycerol-phosphate synthase subunit HisF
MSNLVKPIRLVARLDVKGEKLIKGVHLEGLRVIGSPEKFAKKYYDQGSDEIIYMDIVASLYGRSNLVNIVRRTANDVFVPMTVGGGVRTVEDVGDLLRAGADKIAVNTAAVNRPELISEIARKFGSQCMVLSIEAKRIKNGNWEIYTDCGRERTGLSAIDWAMKGVSLGAGEILLTSVDQEGTRKGFDIKLISEISNSVNVPIISSGGYGELNDIDQAVTAGTDAIAFADALHYDRTSFDQLREYAIGKNIQVRKL